LHADVHTSPDQTPPAWRGFCILLAERRILAAGGAPEARHGDFLPGMASVSGAGDEMPTLVNLSQPAGD
jgi:hypothetical protein